MTEKPIPCKGCIHLRYHSEPTPGRLHVRQACKHPACNISGEEDEVFSPSAEAMRLHGPCGWDAKLRESKMKPDPTWDYERDCPKMAEQCKCGGTPTLDTRHFLWCRKCDEVGPSRSTELTAVQAWNKEMVKAKQ